MAKKIYVVDDNDDIRQIAVDLYSRRNYNAVGFSDADSLLETIAKGELPDLILMDTDMPPGIKGYEACKKLKETNRNVNHIKIIGMSGNDYKDEWTRAGADHYFSKPLNLFEVLSKTKELLGE
ncbi:response regulator [Candidatus Woesearchaeota archaeon]|nr:response regulator [Candidatus Woesearchaeota archaeon]